MLLFRNIYPPDATFLNHGGFPNGLRTILRLEQLEDQTGGVTVLGRVPADPGLRGDAQIHLSGNRRQRFARRSELLHLASVRVHLRLP